MPSNLVFSEITKKKLMVKLFSKGSRANTKLKNGCDENLIPERNYLTGQRLQLRKFYEALTRNSEVLSSF